MISRSHSIADGRHPSSMRRIRYSGVGSPVKASRIRSFLAIESLRPRTSNRGATRTVGRINHILARPAFCCPLLGRRCSVSRGPPCPVNLLQFAAAFDLPYFLHPVAAHAVDLLVQIHGDTDMVGKNVDAVSDRELTLRVRHIDIPVLLV